jgi:hypothetical protein
MGKYIDTLILSNSLNTLLLFEEVEIYLKRALRNFLLNYDSEVKFKSDNHLDNLCSETITSFINRRINLSSKQHVLVSLNKNKDEIIDFIQFQTWENSIL